MNRAVFLFCSLLLTAAVLLTGCGHTVGSWTREAYALEPVSPGNRVGVFLEQSDEENSFSFVLSIYSSSNPNGRYWVEDGVLILQAQELFLSEDGVTYEKRDKEGEIYRFQIEGNKLIFDGENSFPITAFKEDAGMTVRDGTVLTFLPESEYSEE